jgi:hypothetical protein
MKLIHRAVIVFAIVGVHRAPPSAFTIGECAPVR